MSEKIELEATFPKNEEAVREFMSVLDRWSNNWSMGVKEGPDDHIIKDDYRDRGSQS